MTRGGDILALRADRQETERSHWWFTGRRAILAKLAAGLPPGPSLDLGCGFSSGLPRKPDSEISVSLDLDITKLATLHDARGTQPVQGTADQLPFDDGVFSSVLMLDVLEHVRDDFLALTESFRVLHRGGAALITVPAYPSLWSAHDEAEMHLRRYRRKDFLALCSGAGFEIARSGYFNMMFLPAAAAWRVLSRRFYRRRTPRDDFIMFPKPINRFLSGILASERFVIDRIPLPFGLSIFALLQKS